MKHDLKFNKKNLKKIEEQNKISKKCWIQKLTTKAEFIFKNINEITKKRR